ncbi:restriction endonuclease subunit S [Shewanella basaltis]|uniref:restriction endonuclease subunit S n=1 Tax=Shewanella basaltis TaxID=472183 RepID=UPI00200C5CDB|nr:restriction endonuclease subunit S [Shewanella basaltis]MCL1114432.1 restriction endonuclease subunit S [Shewanella basaltis]
MTDLSTPTHDGPSEQTAESLITQNIDIWTTAIEQKSSAGRGTSNKFSLYGIKKLRELILELAVRGKLVPQDAEDEPAKYLYERIENYLCNKIGKKSLPILKRDKSVFEPSEFHYELPAHWLWCELQGITLFLNGKAHEQYVTNTSDFVLINSKFVSSNGTFKKYSTERLTPLSSFDIAMVMSDVPNGRALARCYLVEEDNKYTLNQRICGLSSSPELNMRYLMIALDRNKYLLSYNDGKKQSNLKKVQVMSCPIALPPVKEQHRIVAKVDELMSLCDALEAQTEASIAAHQTLVETLLNALLQPNTTQPADSHSASPESSFADSLEPAFNDSFVESWHRVAEHFDTLFTTEASIDTLKQTILQLAVMGKLVPQDPNDEPAAKLLERIKAEKAQLVKDGKIKKQKPLPAITDEEKPFELPQGWEWCYLQDALDVRDGTHDSPKDALGSNTIPLITSKNFIDGEIDFENARRISKADHDEISKRSLVEVDDILFSMIGGNIGNQVIVKDSRPFSIKNVALFKFIDKSATLPNYIKIFTEELALELQNQASGGAQPFVSLGKLRSLTLGLPPQAEQHRIVAKVDELMALCDQLKTRLSDAQTTQLHLTDAIVEQAV